MLIAKLRQLSDAKLKGPIDWIASCHLSKVNRIYGYRNQD